MPFRVRPARLEDLPALMTLAVKSGGGFTNLPPDEPELGRRLALSAQALATDITAPSGELYLIMLEDVATSQVIGTASLFSKLGVEWPFYSYKINRLIQTNKEIGRSLSSEVLFLVNDFDGFSEVGGLFVDPDWRKDRAGKLMARSRYLFIAQNRLRFGQRIVAELRGLQASDGRWPFWEGLGRHFFDMEFEDADRFNSLRGNQFIADLMPKFPIYVRLLPPDAQSAVGQPNKDGEPAYKMLMDEGFRMEGHVDIFDAGPTVFANVDELTAIRASAVAIITAIAPVTEGPDYLVASGVGAQFCASRGRLTIRAESCTLDPDLADALEVTVGTEVRYVLF